MTSYNSAQPAGSPEPDPEVRTSNPAPDYGRMLGMGRQGRLVNYTTRTDRPEASVDLGRLQEVFSPRVIARG